MKNTNRGEVIATTMTLLSAMDSKNYVATKKELLDMGFTSIKTADIEADKTDAYKKAIERYKEAYSPFCIIIVIHDNGKTKEIIQDQFRFEYYCNSNDVVGEEFYVWHCSAAEKARLLQTTHQNTEMEVDA